jgi:hypothetical protein
MVLDPSGPAEVPTMSRWLFNLLLMRFVRFHNTLQLYLHSETSN